MKKIEHVSNWNEHDELDGDVLEGGETLRIEWPNGRVTKETIKVRKGSKIEYDHGHSGEYRDWYSYVNKHFNGVPVQVRLAGLKAEKIK